MASLTEPGKSFYGQKARLLKCLFIIFLFHAFYDVRAYKLPGSSSASNHRSEYSVNAGKLSANVFIDSLAVHKAAHEMLVFSNGNVLKRYTICLGKNPVGPKQFEGDFKTPEGHYFINAKNNQCQFHRGLQISYPNKDDIKRAQKLGRSPGGGILIHGLPNGQENVGPNRYRNDWTWGCVGLRNNEIDELFPLVKIGTPVCITK
jgi:murein L,D-transpeptidase YafK